MFNAAQMSGLEYVPSADGLSMFATLSLGGGGGVGGELPRSLREKMLGEIWKQTNFRNLSPRANTMQYNARQGNIFQRNIILIQYNALPYSSIEHNAMQYNTM